MIREELTTTLTEELLGTSGVRALVYTRGDGSIDRAFGDHGLEGRRLAEWADVIGGALDSADAGGVGGGMLRTAILVYLRAVLVVAALPARRRLVVVASEEASLGLLLTQVRRIAEEESQ